MSGLPDAIACARYHVLSNSVGGVPVEYAEESATKAWVRFRYPRWMFDGPTLCGVPVESSRGFLNGWYARNGESLNNPRLAFVCVSEDMTGEFGFCGYFREFDFDLAADQRLQFARGECPPPFDQSAQPELPANQWDADRIAKANRNYAMAYVKNAIDSLIETVGLEPALALATRAARLTGLQYFQQLAAKLERPDGDYEDAAGFLAEMFRGLGDSVDVQIDRASRQAVIRHSNLRILSGVSESLHAHLLACWVELWLGTVHSHQILKRADVEFNHDMLTWTISDR